MKRSTAPSKTPSDVMLAISVIANYCDKYNFEQAIINRNGGASFLLDDIYKQVLGEEIYNAIVDEAKKTRQKMRP